MPITDLFIDYNIETAPEGHKHYREGWVNIECPHCSGSEGYHLGFNTEGSYFYCWRCGSHFIQETIQKLLQVTFTQANNLTEEYRLSKSFKPKSKAIKIGKHKFKYPSGVSKMSFPHRRYLERRNFDPDQIEKEWGVLGTSPTSKLDGIPYGYRILVPLNWKGEVVSFQCRDYTNKQPQKYMACPQKRELVHHKDILYGNNFKGVGICVEGVTDVWRLGSAAFATLGIGYTDKQLKLISQLFDKVFIIFDPEKQAQQRAREIQMRLKFLGGIKAHTYTELETDPGSLSDQDARHLLKELKLVPE